MLVLCLEIYKFTKNKFTMLEWSNAIILMIKKQQQNAFDLWDVLRWYLRINKKQEAGQLETVAAILYWNERKTISN